MVAALPRFRELRAPSHWRVIDFISDLHLQAAQIATFDAWHRYMRETPADAVFVLGDLFEVWVGDDCAAEPGFMANCGAILQATAARLDVFFMHGNRDFLVGDGFLKAHDTTLLADPTVLGFAGERWLLSHGDALCLADTDYMRFREQVRSTSWQRDFLDKPLTERKEIGRALREQSEARKRSAAVYVDLDGAAVNAWLEAADARVMIHGHTHRPANHAVAGRERVVLSDWDAQALPPRKEVLRLDRGGLRRIALP